MIVKKGRGENREGGENNMEKKESERRETERCIGRDEMGGKRKEKE